MPGADDAEAEQQRLVPGSRYLEERAVLLAECDLAVVEAPGDERQLEVGDGFVKSALVGALDHAHIAALLSRSRPSLRAYPRVR